MNKSYCHQLGLGLVYLALGCGQLAVASPPPNDACTGAEIVPGAGPFPYLSSVVDVLDATSSNDPPAPSCAALSVVRGVWYRFTAPGTRLYTISCSEDTATTVQDTVIAIYTSANGCSGPFTELDCNDDSGYLQSAISRTLTSNVTYYIVVWMASDSPPLPGKTSVQLRVSQPVAPANDTCAGAEIIPASGPFPFLTSVADTTLATTTGDPPAPTCVNPFVRSVWYRFTPDMTASHEISTCTNTTTTVYDTLLSVYTSSGGCGGTFARVACNNSSGCGGNSFDPNQRAVLTLPLTNGVTYYIVAWESGNDPYTPGETSMQLRVSRFLAPTTTTSPASGINSTGAVLNASVIPNGVAATVQFEYGVSMNYGSKTAPMSIGDGTVAFPVSSQLTGLLPGTTYHFRVLATNSIGTTAGSDRTFAWSTTPPSVTSPQFTNGNLVLRFTGQSGQLYLVQATTDFVNWVNLGYATDLGSGWYEFRAATLFAWRFYRAVAP